jgi:predicted ATPase
MEKIVKLTESDLNNIIKKVIKENYGEEFGFDNEEEYFKDFIEADEYAEKLYWELHETVEDNVRMFLEHIDFYQIVSYYQEKFRERYVRYSDLESYPESDYIESLMSIKVSKKIPDEKIMDIGDSIIDSFK